MSEIKYTKTQRLTIRLLRYHQNPHFPSQQWRCLVRPVGECTAPERGGWGRHISEKCSPISTGDELQYWLDQKNGCITFRTRERSKACDYRWRSWAPPLPWVLASHWLFVGEWELTGPCTPPPNNQNFPPVILSPLPLQLPCPTPGTQQVPCPPFSCRQ